MLKAFRFTIGAIFVVPLLILSYIFGVSIASLFRACKNEKASLAVSHFWLRILIWAIMFFFGGRVHVIGRENIPTSGRICFVANHQSMIDVVALLYPAHVWCGFIGKVEIKKIPIVSAWFDLIKAVYIDRKSPRDSIKAILQGSKQIEEGYPMGIFPEGTRSKDEVVHEFKAGSFKMATRVGATIIPVVIKGTRDIFENGYSLLPRPVYVEYLKPIDTSVMDEDEIKNVHTVVENEIRSAYNALPSRKM